MKKLILIFAVGFLFALTAKGQGIQDIELIFQHSLRIAYHRVEIRAINLEDKYKLAVKVTPLRSESKWRVTKIDTAYTLTREEFDHLKTMATSISPNDLIKGMIGFGHDGTTWELSFGDFQNKIIYKMWTIDYQTKERGLEKFEEICEYMLNLGRLNYRKVK